MRHRIAALRLVLTENMQDPVLRNSYLILMTTVLMAGAGSVFWVIAARLTSPQDVGYAGSLVSAAEALAVLALLGLDVMLIRALQSSDRKAADVNAGVVIVVVAATVLAVGYVLILPITSPALHRQVPWMLTPIFVVLVAGTAVNQLTDHLFLAIDRVVVNLRINGFLHGAIKLVLPLGLASWGAFGLYTAVGIAGTVAAVASVYAIQRALPGSPWRRPSREFRASRRFARAGYVASTLYLAPQLVFPLLIINQRGAEESAHYFVGFQIVTLLNALVLAMCNSMYVEGARHPDRVRAIVAKAGRSLAVATSVGTVVLVVVSPYALLVFGRPYVIDGTMNLRFLAVGSLGVALNLWCAVRLRMARHHTAMMSVQAGTTALMLVLALLLIRYGIEGVALAWGIGQLSGGIVGYVVSRTFAPLHDAPVGTPPLETKA